MSEVKYLSIAVTFKWPATLTALTD